MSFCLDTVVITPENKLAVPCYHLSEKEFDIKGDLPVSKIKCFTTRPDTLFGFSFLALSIDHEISSFFKDDKNFLKFNQ